MKSGEPEGTRLNDSLNGWYRDLAPAIYYASTAVGSSDLKAARRSLAHYRCADRRDSPALAFGRGLSSEGEPDLALRDDTGRLRLWIEVGLPDEKWVRKAASQADRVVLIAYGGARADLWWRASAGALARHDGLRVLVLDESGTRALAALAARTMSLSVTIQEGQALVGDGSRGAEIAIGVLKPGPVDPGPGADRW